MDLAHIGKSALVIPTPGQQEQEYLGELHTRSGRFSVQAQDRLNIREVLERGGVKEATEVKEITENGLERALQELATLVVNSCA
jgi:hypothetical protein